MPVKWVALVSRSLELFFFASIGSGADFSQISLLTTYRPDLLHPPTTNGEHCTGDVTNLGEAIGQTVWVFFIMKLFMREVFFSLFFFAELALAGIECRAPVSDLPRGPSETMSRRSLVVLFF